MDIQEYENLYFQIEEIIDYYKMGWVLQEVNDSIREGKIVSIEGRLEKTKQKKTPRIKREDYSAQEKLLILLEAFERAIINRVDLEKELGKFLIEEMSDSRLEAQILFSSDDEKEEVRKFIFPYESAKLRQQEAEELQNLLNSLRLEVQK
ncbi:hypothetical protein H6G06_23645 [Anabaena sphaerica FACHB-251]|uniref:Uncharacterized protein n=1 Tax=Anabaena sphaerica FACHB-251 TaxID=2692883 RepID=A0A926WKR4_9NOST|nr:hypothetical protein [Anabaena sphaerica]MBD2296394.1 hypothetical protein [Anabaena sphaerica FACHB-251]